ncbi:MAG: 16S rRNA (cytosine(1402)-N(4))-methyltransferase [Desulfobacterales bacterium]|nr:MAG: 16S rRNA (cytosine(1402)-N(4))-methyltransferase [Desulfobacterales bacterium]
MEFEHTSVLNQEVHKYQNLKQGYICADGTLGGSNHALSTIQAILPDGLLIGIDQDQDAIAHAEQKLAAYRDNVRLFHRNFSDLPQILTECHITGVDSILLDLGFSLNQITRSQRGFSFQKDEPLDMRMDTRNPLTAHEVVNCYTETQLADIIFQYGEERYARRIAAVLVKARIKAPIQTSRELARLTVKAIPASATAKQKIHPATRTFQALRIEVNRELERLEAFVNKVPDMLNTGGRISIISFHSLEDRIVKQRLRAFENGCSCPKGLPQCLCGFVPSMKLVTRKPIIASDEEITANPMARSAKLRVAEKL